MHIEPNKNTNKRYDSLFILMICSKNRSVCNSVIKLKKEKKKRRKLGTNRSFSVFSWHTATGICTIILLLLFDELSSVEIDHWSWIMNKFLFDSDYIITNRLYVLIKSSRLMKFQLIYTYLNKMNANTKFHHGWHRSITIILSRNVSTVAHRKENENENEQERERNWVNNTSSITIEWKNNNNNNNFIVLYWSYNAECVLIKHHSN